VEDSGLAEKELRMRPEESGKKGGLATRDNHLMLCPCCGSPIKSQFYQEVGREGGQTTLRRHGREFYSRIGAIGGRGNTREKRLLCQS